jgi:hypothetical protein
VSHDDPSRASHALLTAALGGLLSVAACSGQRQSPDAPQMLDGSAAVYQCPGDPVPNASISSSTTVSLTLSDFTSQCDGLGGVVEIQPHCGGSNACRGMSYDTGTQVLTQHSCRGLNTCAGYTCIVCN